MKRLVAVITALIFLFLCGCKGTDEYLSDFTFFIKDKVESAYSELAETTEKISNGISSIITKDYIEEYEIISVEPAQIDGKGLLAYNSLNKNQKLLYSVLVSAILDMQLKKIDITKYTTDNTFNDASIAHKAVLCDRPDIFWAPKAFSLITFNGRKNTYIQFADDDGNSFFGINKSERDYMQAELNAVTEKIVSQVAALDTTFEKELFIHDYLCENIVYDSAAAENIDSAEANSLSAYGALVKGSCVCEGYSRAFQLLCIKSGIPCSLMYGKHEDVAHMWNIVDIDNQTYYVDVTFDDSSEVAILHCYFNVTKSDIENDHIFFEKLSPDRTYEPDENINFFYDECQSNEYNYFIKKGLIITEDCSWAVPAIIKEKEAGKNCAELKNITSRSTASAFRLLRRKARMQINLEYYYTLENDNVLIAVWQN